MLVKAVRKTLSDFSRDRSLKRLSFNEEQIHKFDKSVVTKRGFRFLQISVDLFMSAFTYIQNVLVCVVFLIELRQRGLLGAHGEGLLGA